MDWSVIEQNFALAQVQQSSQAIERRRFAAAAGSKKRCKGAAPYLKVKIVERRRSSKATGDAPHKHCFYPLHSASWCWPAHPGTTIRFPSEGRAVALPSP